MIHIQLVSRSGENLQTLIRSAIAEGRITAFVTSRVKGGVKIVHKKYPGVIRIQRSAGPLLATVSCTNPKKEWQLLESFVGRIAYHLSEHVTAMNIQFDERDSE